jgi:LmbE family N-acetylglucosaminyl deacetylase
MRWVYLSPHFDDVVLSCGGLVWEQVQSGQEVQIWTICAGGPQPGEPISSFAQGLHDRWETGPAAVSARRQEDALAARQIGAALVHWDLPDCIYRRLPDGSWLVNGEDDLWKPVHPQEQPLMQRLCEWMAARVQPGDTLVCPLTLGNHVDHRLVRAAAEQAARQLGLGLWFYSDYPYVMRDTKGQAEKVGPGWEKDCRSVSPEALAAWQDAVAGYASQISTFWGGLDEMKASLEAYWQSGGGTCLWKPAQVQDG